MGIPTSIIDMPLEQIATGDRVSFCSEEPATVAGIAAVSLCSAPLTPGVGNGDWTIADGDVSGRKLMLAEQADMQPTANGTISWLVIDDGTSILATNPVTPQDVLTTQLWTSPAVKIWEIEDPTYAS